MALDFTYCPIESRLIRTLEEARAYYFLRLVEPGPHAFEVRGKRVMVRFNPEEIHAFSSEEASSPDAPKIARVGVSHEVRYFNRERARLMDQILVTLQNPGRTLQARIQRALCVYGPAYDGARRMCVIVGPENAVGCWYVRTAYPVSQSDFAKAVAGARGRGATWPP